MNSTSFQPKAVFFTCMDSRMIPTRFTETNVGDMFVGECLYSLQDFERIEFLHQSLVNELCVSNIRDTKWPIGWYPMSPSWQWRPSHLSALNFLCVCTWGGSNTIADVAKKLSQVVGILVMKGGPVRLLYHPTCWDPIPILQQVIQPIGVEDWA